MESQLCQLWKKVAETPKDPQVTSLTEGQQAKLGAHANFCPTCQKVFERHKRDPIPMSLIKNLTSLDQLPLMARILCKGAAQLSPEEQVFHEMALKQQHNKMLEIETALKAFINHYPDLNLANFGIATDVPIRALWNVNHFLMLMARRFCRHELHGAELQTAQILPDGTMVVNQDSRIPSETCQAEACATASNVSVDIDPNLAEKIILWLRAASQLHPQLFNPELNKLDHTGKKDFLAPWRV